MTFFVYVTIISILRGANMKVNDIIRKVNITKSTFFAHERRSGFPVSNPKRNRYGHRVYTEQEVETIVNYFNDFYKNNFRRNLKREN